MNKKPSKTSKPKEIEYVAVKLSLAEVKQLLKLGKRRDNQFAKSLMDRLVDAMVTLSFSLEVHREKIVQARANSYWAELWSADMDSREKEQEAKRAKAKEQYTDPVINCVTAADLRRMLDKERLDNGQG